MKKKMMLLAGMALAAIAFAVPASASALEWTDEGAAFEGTASDTLTGFISFGNPAPGQTKFGCEAHAGFTVTGGSTTGTLDSFNPTTGTCKGEGLFLGCELESDETTIPAGTTIQIVETNKVTVKSPAGEPIVIHYVFAAPCHFEQTKFTVEDLTFATTNSNFTSVAVSCAGIAHFWARSPTVESTSTIALFGAFGTETDTAGIS